MKTTRTRVVLLACIIILAGAAILGFVVIRRGFSARDNPSWIETVMAKTARRMAIPAKAKKMANPVPNSPENLQQAEAHWADHCATCHANNGSGDTVIGKNLYPKAPDMRLPATQELTDGELYYTIQNGIRLTGMPAWGEARDNDEDTWKLVHLIRHLSQLTPEEEKAMEHMNPKGPEEWKEEQEEQEFLNQGTPAPQEQSHHGKH